MFDNCRWRSGCQGLFLVALWRACYWVAHAFYQLTSSFHAVDEYSDPVRYASRSMSALGSVIGRMVELLRIGSGFRMWKLPRSFVVSGFRCHVLVAVVFFSFEAAVACTSLFYSLVRSVAVHSFSRGLASHLVWNDFSLSPNVTGPCCHIGFTDSWKLCRRKAGTRHPWNSLRRPLVSLFFVLLSRLSPPKSSLDSGSDCCPPWVPVLPTFELSFVRPF